MKAIRAFFDTIESLLTLRVTEIREGVNLVEAVAADEFETELRAVTFSPEQREDIRRGAIIIAQSGVSAAEAAEALTAWARMAQHPSGTKEGTP